MPLKELFSPTPENPFPCLKCRAIPSTDPAFSQLDDLQRLSYAIYHQPGIALPKEESAFHLGPGWNDTYRIVAEASSYTPNPTDSRPSPYSQNIISQAEALYPQVAGFYQLSFGRLVPPPEINEYLDWSGWEPNRNIAYISALSFNPSPTFYPQQLAETLLAIHAHGSRLISQRFSPDQPYQILAIMAPNVATFVARAKISIQPLGGSLRWRDSQGQLTQVATTTFMKYPGYWGSEDSPEQHRPQLWEIGLLNHE